eukprot:2565283-Pyramimonas_sp.AAC.1
MLRPGILGGTCRKWSGTSTLGSKPGAGERRRPRFTRGRVGTLPAPPYRDTAFAIQRRLNT